MATFLKNTHKLLHNTTIRNTTDTPADHSYLAGQHKSIRKEIPRRGHPYLNANPYRYQSYLAQQHKIYHKETPSRGHSHLKRKTLKETTRISHGSAKYRTRKPLTEATRTSKRKHPTATIPTHRTAHIDTKGNPSSTSHSTHGKSLSETTRISQDSATQNLPRDHPHQKSRNRPPPLPKQTNTYRDHMPSKGNTHTTYTHNLPRTCAGKA